MDIINFHPTRNDPWKLSDTSSLYWDLWDEVFTGIDLVPDVITCTANASRSFAKYRGYLDGNR